MGIGVPKWCGHLTWRLVCCTHRSEMATPDKMRQESSDQEQRLTAVALAVATCQRLAALRHATDVIDFFLLPSRAWALETASERGFVRLLDRLLPLEWTGVSDHFRWLRFTHAIDNLTRWNHSVDVIGWWVTRYLPGHECEAVESAVLNGNVGLLEWLTDKGVCPLQNMRRDFRLYASESDFAYWLHENLQGVNMSLDVGPKLGDVSLNHQYLVYVRWAVQQRSRYEITGVALAMDYAAFHGLLDDLKWLHDQSADRCSVQVLRDALRNGHLETAQWLCATYPDGFFKDPQEVKVDLALAQWVMSAYNWKEQDGRMECVERSILHACRHGTHEEEVLQLVQFLFSVRLPESRVQVQWPFTTSTVLPWTRRRQYQQKATDVMNAAASSGLLAVVKWLHTNRSDRCSINAMDQAATNGHLDVVQWLHANRSEGCSYRAMCGAIENNHMRVVQWLHANRSEGCANRGLEIAAAKSNIEMAQWLRDHQFSRCTFFAMDRASARGDFQTVKWIHTTRSGSCTDDAMDSAAKHGHLEVMKYLHVHQLCHWTEQALSMAIENGHVHVVTWLLAMDPSQFIQQMAVRVAAERGHLAVLYALTPFLSYLYWDSDFLNSLATSRQFATLEWGLRSSLLAQEVVSQTPFAALYSGPT